jgi:hypothetical protein
MLRCNSPNYACRASFHNLAPTTARPAIQKFFQEPFPAVSERLRRWAGACCGRGAVTTSCKGEHPFGDVVLPAKTNSQSFHARALRLLLHTFRSYLSKVRDVIRAHLFVLMPM